MLDKHFLQSFLKVNNASAQMSDAEVHGILGKAGWSQSEVEAAIALLRSQAGSLGTPPVNLNAGMEFSSSQLSNLLGVDVEIDPASLRRHSYHAASGVGATHDMFVHFFMGCVIVILSLVAASALGILFLYFFEIGPFHRF